MLSLLYYKMHLIIFLRYYFIRLTVSTTLKNLSDRLSILKIICAQRIVERLCITIKFNHRVNIIC